MAAPPRMLSVLALLGLAALLLVPAFADRFYVQLFTKVMTMAIFAMSLGLLVSGVGLVSLGHGAFFALAAYIVALVSPATEGASLWLALPLAIGGAALAALAIGALAIRTSGVYFIMITLAFGQMLFYLFHDTKIAGGADGLFIAARPVVAVGGIALLQLDHRPSLFYATLVAMAATYLFLGIVSRAPFGKAIEGIRVNEQRMRALGYDTYLHKLVAFGLSGALAGFSGFIYATQYTYVNPALFSWHQSGLALMMVILGGLRSRLGPLVGAFALVLIEELVQAWTTHWLLLIGVFVISVVLTLPNGLVDLLPRLLPRDRRRGVAVDA
ncbi:MAG: branched-chain amino acid ABC transporter permease [Proteobacteria bacterium]|nr:branched-chain amino acid ABC transporter permease [Pseudomonadota bacterium]MBI3496390.1 branched-chain amino acid ABC transporter permease [Pseudomonadota bacterium]